MRIHNKIQRIFRDIWFLSYHNLVSSASMLKLIKSVERKKEMDSKKRLTIRFQEHFSQKIDTDVLLDHDATERDSSRDEVV